MLRFSQGRRSMLNAQNAGRKFGEEMTLYLDPILNSINMNASAGGSDMLLFNKAVKWG